MCLAYTETKGHLQNNNDNKNINWYFILKNYLIETPINLSGDTIFTILSKEIIRKVTLHGSQSLYLEQAQNCLRI